MISIFLNGEKRELLGEVDLKSLIDLLSLSGQRVAVELNRKVVRRDDWTETPIRDGDRLEVVHFVGGG